MENESYRYYSPFLHCHHCPEAICLPYSYLPENDPWLTEEDEDQLEWPPDGWKKVFACIACGRVSEYTFWDVLWRPVPKSARGQYYSGANCFCVELQCANKNCRLPLKLHIETANSDKDGIMRMLRNAFFWGDLPCGHPLLPIPANQYKLYRVEKID
jgi:hypothetical protein